jgi:pyridoxamine 5'-phosphate oxidase
MNINETLENLRVSYRRASLDIKDCATRPDRQFETWLKEALECEVDEPNAFILSTIKEQKPRARVLLLKGLHQSEFIFYTNYNSSKGLEISECPYVAMTFLWLPLQRQIRIEGTIKKVDATTSDEYFFKRPRGNQIGALASPQSQKLNSREELEEMFQNAEKKYAKEAILRPIHWGGYAVNPNYYEFWQGRDNRMHDRIAYEKNGDQWSLHRLAP